jgi:serine/threonine-protein kinase HipA
MKNCLICLNPIFAISKAPEYHDECVLSAFGSLDIEPKLDCSVDDFYRQARKNLIGFCLAGVQAKFGLSMGYREGTQKLMLSGQNSTYILKPCPPSYPNLASNEHVSQEIMRLLGFNVPLCGMLKFSDGTSAYFIKRYDRLAERKMHQEDMLAALDIPNVNENVKYKGSYEAVALTLKQIGGIQLAAELIKRVICAYLIGNGDYHLKNISVIYPEHEINLSPVYDFVNTHLYGDTDNLCLSLLINEPDIDTFDDYYCLKKKDFILLGVQVGVPEETIVNFIDDKIAANLDGIFVLIENSELNVEQKLQYQTLVRERAGYLTL